MLAFLDRHAGWLAIALCALIALTGCNDVPPPRDGSAAANAASAQARAGVAANAADAAGRTAADLLGEAAAAEERARQTGLQADIDKAVDARVRAVAAQAKHQALRELEAPLQAAATEAVEKAEAARQIEQDAQDYRSWLRLCRIVGLAGIAGGVLIGAIVGWLTKRPRAGVGIALLLGVTGATCIAVGPATAWMPWIVGAAALIAVAWWALGHRLDRITRDRAAAAAIAGSRAIDAVEKLPPDQAKAIKAAFADHLQAAGVADRVKALRGSDRLWSVQ